MFLTVDPDEQNLSEGLYAVKHTESEPVGNAESLFFFNY